MWRKLFLVFLGVSSICYAEKTKFLYNPFTGKLDAITELSSTTLPSGSTQYIQNTLTPTTNTQSFAVQVGSFSVAGWYIMDSANCLWQTQIDTSGTLVTTKIHCPTVGFFLMEDGTFILQEDATKISTE